MVASIAILVLAAGAEGPLVPDDLRCEHLVDPLGIDARAPRLSWSLHSEAEARGERQSAWQVLVAGSTEALAADRGDLWDSGKVESAETAVLYAGRPLRSRERCWWKARAWDGEGRPGPWSRQPGTFSVGLLDPADWTAKWIVRDPAGEAAAASPLAGRKWIWTPGGDPRVRAPAGTACFRRRFVVPEGRAVVRAEFLLTADNAFRLWVNGAEAGRGDRWEEVHRIDVAGKLRAGENVVAIAATNTQPSPAGLVGILEIRFATGEPLRVPIDAAWKAGAEAAGWERAGFDDSAWPAAREIAAFGEAPWEEVARSAGPREPLPIFRREFAVERPLRRATVSACGLGHFELRVDGKKAGEDFLEPGWTNYRKTCLYVTRDITRLLREGPNAIGVLLGNGMYNVEGGRYVKFRGSFGKPKIILELFLEYMDGTTATVVTDGSWKAAPGPIVFSCIYGGEDFDAREEEPGWDRPGFAEGPRWRPSAVVEGPGGVLRPQMFEPLRAYHLKAAGIRPIPGGCLFDLGRNFSGVPRIAVRGPAGATVRLIPAERLSAAGLADQSDSGGPCWFQYTLRGEGLEEWTPRFSYSGFRWVQVEGAVGPGAGAPAGTPVIEMIEGLFLVPALAGPYGHFMGYDPSILGKIQGIIDQAILSNMKSVLTDCPHREKLGWLEEAHLMGPSIMYGHDVAALYRKIARDMAEAQTKDGLVPDIAPEFTVFAGGFRDSPEWGSACVLAPWQAYEFYGDPRILEESYPTMVRYVEYLGTKAKGHILSHGLGDWADVGSEKTPLSVPATTIYCADVVTLGRVADVLGKPADARKWAGLAAEIRAAFDRAHFHPETNSYATGSQASNAMALALGLVEPGREAAVLENLVKDVRAHGDHTTTGDVGHRFVLRALADGGRSDVVLAMALRTDHPSYGYQIEHGATALAELWDGPTRGASQNHFMMGHILEWFYRDLAGIRVDWSRPPAERIAIRPAYLDGIRKVFATTCTPGGVVHVALSREGDSVVLDVQLPPNLEATVAVPARDPSAVEEGWVDGWRPATAVPGVKLAGTEAGRAIFRIGSGEYRFRSPR